MRIESEIKYPDIIEKVRQLTEFQKLRVYLRYYANALSLRCSSIVLDTMKEDWQHGWGEPDKRFMGIAFYKLWKGVKILTYAEFVSDDNVKLIDCGEAWNQNGYAQRWRVETYGIYDYYWKHESELA